MIKAINHIPKPKAETQNKGSLVSNLCQNVANGTGLKVNTSDNAENSVIFGIAEIIRNKKYRNLTFEV